jgi:gamma-glutamylcyclotransferase (GGCT)/AIG2-like uncharacterized protein YtfP
MTPVAKRYFLYGTLRSQEPNYSRFNLAAKSICHGKITFSGARMYDLGGYPCVVLTGEPDQYVVGEVVEFTDPDCENAIRQMELSAGYSIKSIDTSFGPALIFVFERPPDHGRLIHGGDWLPL